MSSQREWSAGAYPTRRQLREAARAARSADSPAESVAGGGAAASETGTERAEPAVPAPAEPAVPAPLTRRQIRERERVEQARQAAEQSPAASAPSAPGAPEQHAAPSASTAPEPAATDDEPTASTHAEEASSATDENSSSGTDQTAARVAADGRPATAAEPVSWAAIVPYSGETQAPQKSTARRWLPRLAVLGALAALTTVVPLTGAALPTASSDPSTGTPLAETSALDVFSSGGTHLSSDASAALAADPLASVRSMVASSRSDERSSTCAAGAMEANGVLASEVEVITTPEVMMPLSEGTYHYTSRYGVRAHPIFGSYGQHTGLDMAAAAGTPIHAVADGTVVHAGNGLDGRSSMLVIIEHEVDGEPIWTWYVHMYPNGVYVSEGQQVSAGEAIGAVGSYGNSTGPHLHFEVHLDEAQTTIDPEAWLASNAAPLNSETLQCAGS